MSAPLAALFILVCRNVNLQCKPDEIDFVNPKYTVSGPCDQRTTALMA